MFLSILNTSLIMEYSLSPIAKVWVKECIVLRVIKQHMQTSKQAKQVYKCNGAKRHRIQVMSGAFAHDLMGEILRNMKFSIVRQIPTDLAVVHYRNVEVPKEPPVTVSWENNIPTVFITLVNITLIRKEGKAASAFSAIYPKGNF